MGVSENALIYLYDTIYLKIMQKSIKKNYIFNLTYRILSLITPLVMTPYISRVLGAELIGKNSYATSITSYFCLFAAMGTVSYGQREISYFQDNIEKRSLKFWNIEFLSCITAIIAMLLYILYIFFVSRDRILAIILIINILAIAVDISWFFQGMEEFGKITTRNFIFKILHVVFMLVFIKSRNDFYLYVFGNVSFTIISAASLWFFIPEYVNKITYEYLKPYREFWNVWSLFVPTIAMSIYTLLDKTMIGYFTNTPIQSGYYEQTVTIIRFLLTFVTSLGTVMIPRVGYCFENKETKKIKSYMYRSYNFVWFLGIPLCFGIISTADNFIPWFLGKEFLNAIPLIKVLAFLLIAIGVSNVTGVQYLIPTKRQDLFTKSVIIGACLNFILNLCLIPFLKAVGAAIASVTSEVVIAIIQLYWVKNELELKEIFTSLWKYTIASFIMFLTVNTIRTRFSPSIVHSTYLVIIGCFVYLVSLFILKETLFWGYVRIYLKNRVVPCKP